MQNAALNSHPSHFLHEFGSKAVKAALQRSHSLTVSSGYHPVQANVFKDPKVMDVLVYI